ncbi:hypothetical protein Lgra_3191 [Legionella gratiana]|uniref:Uncharacterized protein n=1 Tax=Legionella gratiana TaxID=45066 RepID=A0A378JBH6_9GAMM|nr:hypothetical protein [Legionella gratiana]KTD06414.1 hypothetical protein Lgra_3191 [Legionella gratiana]STX45234.1 Uncharacterised protein [Legionella gratiana]
MPKLERNKRIDKFIKTSFQPIRNAMKTLLSKKEDGTDQERNSISLEYNALFAYEEKVVSEFRTLQIESAPSPTSVQRIYESATEATKEAITKLKEHTTSSELILNNLEAVTNFCTTVLTQDNGIKFFDVKGLDIESVKQVNSEIQESWEYFTKSNSSGLI